jgi:hypothetical protein
LPTRFSNPDHNIWNNNGTYWCHYTIHDTAKTKKRVRISLGTKSIEEARQRRDELLSSAAIADKLPPVYDRAMPDISESRAVRVPYESWADDRVPTPPRAPEPAKPPHPGTPDQPTGKPWWKSWIDAVRSFLGLGRR